MTKEKNSNAYDAYSARFKDTNYAHTYHQSSFLRSISELANINKSLGLLVRKFEVKAVLDLLSLCKGNSVLDVPCGSGKLIQDLLDKQYSVIGIDSSKEMLSQIGNRNSGNLLLMEADIRKIPLEDNSVDITICHRFLHRIPPEVHSAALKEIYRVSKGYAIFYFSINRTLTRTIVFIEKFFNIGDRGRIFYMSKNAIKEELSSRGWDFVKDRPVMPLGISTGYVIAVKKKVDAVNGKG